LSQPRTHGNEWWIEDELAGDTDSAKTDNEGGEAGDAAFGFDQAVCDQARADEGKNAQDHITETVEIRKSGHENPFCREEETLINNAVF
jgi:hypothetical protein